jgi:hypothetical protein
MINRYIHKFSCLWLASTGVALLMLAVLAVSTARAADAVPKDESSVVSEFVLRWLADWDAGDYAKCWGQLGPMAQKTESLEKFIEQSKSTHAQTGNIIERKLIEVVGPPNLNSKPIPANTFIKVRFKASFEHKPEVIESVVVRKQADSSLKIGWRAIEDE